MKIGPKKVLISFVSVSLGLGLVLGYYVGHKDLLNFGKQAEKSDLNMNLAKSKLCPEPANSSTSEIMNVGCNGFF